MTFIFAHFSFLEQETADNLYQPVESSTLLLLWSCGAHYFAVFRSMTMLLSFPSTCWKSDLGFRR